MCKSIEHVIGCGKIIKGECSPYDNGEAIELNVPCGGLLGDEGEFYCDDCWKLIEKED